MSDFARYLNIRSAMAPVFTTDHQSIVFLTDITGNLQVWRMPTNATEPPWPEQLTFLPDKVWEVYSPPKGKHLLVLSDVGGNERQQFYLIHLQDDGHEVQRITHADESIHRFGAWHGSGGMLAYTSNVRNGVDFDTYAYDLSSNEHTLLAEGKGNRHVLAWSPNGESLLIATGIGPLQTELYQLDLASGQETHLTAGQPPARYHHAHWQDDDAVWLISDREDDQSAICRFNLTDASLETRVAGNRHQQTGEIDLLAVANGQLAYTFNADGYSRLFLQSAGSEGRAITSLPSGLVKSLHFSADGHTLLLDLQTPTMPPDIWAVEVSTGDVRRLSASNQAGLPTAGFVAPTLIHYPSFDGLEIPAFFYQPQTPPPEGGYPCILYVHGGPTSQVWPDFDVRFQYFLSQGYAILAPNVRGSAGYGRHYATLDDVDKRMDSVTDLKHAVLWLHQQTRLNPERIAIYGRSYGGFMVLAALTEYPDLFAAGIDVVGISNWVTFLERTSAWRRAHREQEYGRLDRDRDLLTRVSPIHKAERIQVPLMVVAGDNDPRVPLSESAQIVDRVRRGGGTVAFIHYADEGHKISKLANRIDSFNQMAAFLHQYL